MLITVQNESVSLSVETVGAEIRHLIRDGEEYIWQRDPHFWPFSAPILFPICGGLQNDRYFLHGKAYTMSKHGFTRNRPFSVAAQTETAIVLETFSDAQTKEMYPFDFRLSVRFDLQPKGVTITYSVENRGDETMYFSVGGHEAYACPGGLEQYELVFDRDTRLERCVLSGGLYHGEREELLLPNGVLRPTYAEIQRCTYVFREHDSDAVLLRRRDTQEPRLRVSFPQFPTLALWTVPDAEYLCIEPWCAFSDHSGATGILSEKDGIVPLRAGEIFERTHTVAVGRDCKETTP